jgi:hemerythrin-like domain-containing protein
MALASETVGVLMNAGLPVLVAATGDLRPPARAIAAIRDEHRTLAVMLHAWKHVLDRARAAGKLPEERLVRALLRCIESFASLHHPKEERHLFARLRERTTSVHAELDELERQHVRDRQLVAGLGQSVDAVYAAPAGRAQVAAAAALESALAQYAAFTWEHLGREEGVILPAAQRCLSEADWLEIDTAFAEQRDPDAAGEREQEFRHLFAPHREPALMPCRT